MPFGREWCTGAKRSTYRHCGDTLRVRGERGTCACMEPSRHHRMPAVNGVSEPSRSSSRSASSALLLTRSSRDGRTAVGTGVILESVRPERPGKRDPPHRPSPAAPGRRGRTAKRSAHLPGCEVPAGAQSRQVNSARNRIPSLAWPPIGAITTGPPRALPAARDVAKPSSLRNAGTFIRSSHVKRPKLDRIVMSCRASSRMTIRQSPVQGLPVKQTKVVYTQLLKYCLAI
jgi:hypothetical protein